MEEIWKDIKGYEGLYQVSNLGRVKHLEFARPNPLTGGVSITKERILKQRLTPFGYHAVLLSKNGKKQWHFVHRLVAEAFISNPDPDNLPIINHKDENKVNNCVDNLEWCDHLYNSNYGTRNKRLSKTKTNNTYNTKPVLCVETGIIYPSIREAARQTNIPNAHISACCLNKPHYKTAGGYHWRHV